MLSAVVFGTIRWCLGVLVPTPQAQQTLNFFQFNCVRRMLGIKRLADETWVDFETRSLRIVRAKVHQLRWTRWGDKRLAAFFGKTQGILLEKGILKTVSGRVVGQLPTDHVVGTATTETRGRQTSSSFPTSHEHGEKDIESDRVQHVESCSYEQGAMEGSTRVMDHAGKHTLVVR